MVGELVPALIVQVPGTVHSKLAPGIFVIEYVWFVLINGVEFPEIVPEITGNSFVTISICTLSLSIPFTVWLT